MNDLLKYGKDYSRLLQLEDCISCWEAELPEMKARLEEMTWNLQQKEAELLQLKSSGLIRKLLGGAGIRREKLTGQIREITAARSALRGELESLEKQILAAGKERESLTGCRETYLAARAEAVLSAAQESRLMMEEISAFAPVALGTAGRIAEALEDACLWLPGDGQTASIPEDERRAACLEKAEAAALRLRDILAVLPEGAADTGSYLKDPRAYLKGSTPGTLRPDRLYQAREQIMTLRNQLRCLLGE